MSDFDLNELEVAPPEVVRQSARDFAVALAETPQFKAYEEATDRLNHDTAAQQAIDAFQAKRESLRAMLLLNAVSEADQAELQRSAERSAARQWWWPRAAAGGSDDDLPDGCRFSIAGDWPESMPQPVVQAALRGA
jgi:hypothetical protein